ncbi:TrbC/VirB2 family protein [Chitinimonas sp. PSY-7]|uniref:TrbC/VirB2 family protein n=1 Tax=Chitinimonas sp. PSY-7 TaxID=3459088 RepID=UPI00403FFC20
MQILSSIWRRLVLILATLSCGIAHAALPWEGPLQQLQSSLTGPVAKSIGVIALAASGGMLAFGGELSDFTKRMMMVVLALSVMLLANNFMSMFG